MTDLSSFLPAPDEWLTFFQNVFLLVGIITAGAITGRQWWKGRRKGVPSVPSDGFAATAAPVPDPELVAARALLARQQQEHGLQLGAIYADLAGAQRSAGALGRRVRSYDYAWPVELTRPYLDPKDQAIIADFFGEDDLDDTERITP